MVYRLEKIGLQLVAAIALFALSACANLPNVRSSFDRTADFTQYKTFAFLSPLATDRDGFQSIVSQQLKAATQSEMEARGLRMDNNAPQLLINFNAALVDKTRVNAMPIIVERELGFYGGGFYGYRRGMYSSWPNYVEQAVVFDYKEGTLSIDVIDAVRNQLVWEGVVTDSSVTQEELADLPTSLSNAVKAAFASYPTKVTAK